MLERVKTWPQPGKKVLHDNMALILFIWARYAVVCCLRGDISPLDPTGGEALRVILGGRGR